MLFTCASQLGSDQNIRTMEGSGSTLVDGRLPSDFINAADIPLHESSTDFVATLATSVPEISFAKSEDCLLSGKPDYRTAAEGGQAVTAVSRQEDAQLELAVEDDGVVEGGDEELVQEGRIGADEDDQAFMYVNSSNTGLQAFDDGLLPTGNLIYNKMEDRSQEENRETELQALAASGTDAVQADTTMLQAPIQASTPSSSADGNSTLGLYPLGSSKNPIRIIQQGNKYTSMQQLTSEQLSQIMQVCKFMWILTVKVFLLA